MYDPTMKLFSFTKTPPTPVYPDLFRSQPSSLNHMSHPSHIETIQNPQTVTKSLPKPLTKRPLPPHITIEPITPATLPSFRRVITLLLPIRYADSFYKESVSRPPSSSLSHVALWHDQFPQPGKRKHPFSEPQYSNLNPFNADAPLEPKVIAGIQCRLEPSPLSSPSTPPEQRLYIQTLAVLSPYRNLGTATNLLDSVIATAITHHSGVKEVYAHVWEANEEALGWYVKRGFEVGEKVEGYYRKLRPAGARVVRRGVGVGDYLAFGEGGEMRVEDARSPTDGGPSAESLESGAQEAGMK